LLGACRTSVPTYASGGLWLGHSIDELVAEARSFVAAGFRAMKMRLGRPLIGEDVERVAAVRQAIGPDVVLMADANQGLTVDHAIRLGRRLEGFNLAWFEEPVPAYDLAGSARVAAALDTPIASGETEYARYGFRDMLKAEAADVLMPDLARVGGVSEFVKVAHMADALDIPVSSHIFTEQSLSVMAALGNATYLEHMPWFAALFAEKLEMRDGAVVVPERPGFGFTFDWDAIERWRLS
jgi:L-alanine-DL-glutamate epimerase-like enolase superfamily enzyme